MAETIECPGRFNHVAAAGLVCHLDDLGIALGQQHQTPGLIFQTDRLHARDQLTHVGDIAGDRGLFVIHAHTVARTESGEAGQMVRLAAAEVGPANTIFVSQPHAGRTERGASGAE